VGSRKACFEVAGGYEWAHGRPVADGESRAFGLLANLNRRLEKGGFSVKKFYKNDAVDGLRYGRKPKGGAWKQKKVEMKTISTLLIVSAFLI